MKRHGQDVADSIELEDESQHTQLLVGEQPPRVRLGSPELLPAAWPNEGCEDEGSEREEDDDQDDQDDQAVEKNGEDEEAIEEAEEEVEEIEEVEGEEGEEEECTEEQAVGQ